MRKILLASTLLLACAAANAADAVATYAGSVMINVDKASINSVDALAAAPGNDVYMGAAFTNMDGVTVKWGETTLAVPGEYTVPSGAKVRSSIFARLNSNLEVVWAIVPDYCNAENNSLHCVSLPDGSVVYSLNLRADNSLQGKALSLTDKGGRKVELNVPVQEAKAYTICAALVCFDADGNCKWSRVVEADNFAAEGVAGTGVSVANLAADESGIYVAGNYDGRYVDFGDGVKAPAAKNTLVSGTKSTGKSPFLAKYSVDGVAQKVRTEFATVEPGSEETQQVVAVDGNDVYFAEFVSMKASSTWSYGGENYTTKGIAYTKLDTGLEDAAAGVISAVGNLTSQLAAANVQNGELLISGNINNNVKQGEKTYTVATANKNENATIRASFDANTPSTIYLSGQYIGQNQLAWVNAAGDKLYTFGYVLTGNVVLLGIYDYANGTLVENQTIAKAGTTKTALLAGDALYGNAFVMKTESTFPGSDATVPAPTINSGLLVKWTIAPEALSGVENVALQTVDEAEAPVEYYNLQGMRVMHPAKGSLVIRRQGTKVAKVIL